MGAHVLLFGLAIGLLAWTSSAQDGCAASDASLQRAQWTVCASLTSPVSWCEYPTNANVTADGDWPSQVTYMVGVTRLLTNATPACLNTTVAREVIQWVNTSQADPTNEGSFTGQWTVFQPGYYNMPMHPGDRIESPGTLGRKCWAFAYLQQFLDIEAVAASLARVGSNIAAFVNIATAAIPSSYTLCQEVMANCFVNASYDPARNGTCPLSVAEFRLGFGRENLKRDFPCRYPYYPG